MTTKQCLLELLDHQISRAVDHVECGCNPGAKVIFSRRLEKLLAARRLVEQGPEEPTP